MKIILNPGGPLSFDPRIRHQRGDPIRVGLMGMVELEDMQDIHPIWGMQGIWGIEEGRIRNIKTRLSCKEMSIMKLPSFTIRVIAIIRGPNSDGSCNLYL